VITTTVYDGVDGFAADYRRAVPRPALHDSVPWLRYCERRSADGMRYLVARDESGAMVGLVALRQTAAADSASVNYDLTSFVELPGPTYPQLFAAVSGVRCLFWTVPERAVKVRSALVGRAVVLADDGGSVLTFGYLSDERVAEEVAELFGPSAGRVPTGADTVLDVAWDDFEAYAVAKPKRCNVRRERRRYLESGIRTAVRRADGFDERTAQLQALLAARYNSVRSVASIVADQRDLTATVGEDVILFLAARGGPAIGVAICLLDGDTLHVRNVGFDYSAIEGVDAYFNLMFYEPIEWGLAHGIRQFRFGSGAYQAKTARGCRLQPLYAAYRTYPRDVDRAGRSPREL
jgi:hypothetical protein